MQADLEAIRMVKHRVDHRGYIDLPSSGQSMYPLIRQGDLCRFVRCERQELVPGDILLFRSREGRLVGHRYLYTSRQGEESWLVCKGDSNVRHDAPIPYREVIGKLLWIKSARRMTLSTHYRARLLGRAFTRFPGCSRYVALYLRWKAKIL